MGSILEGAGVAEETNEGKKITCEFCECILFSDGSVKTRSSRAKKLQTADDRIESLTEQLSESKERVTELETQLTDARSKIPSEIPPPPMPAVKKRGWPFKEQTTGG